MYAVNEQKTGVVYLYYVKGHPMKETGEIITSYGRKFYIFTNCEQ